MFLVRIFCDGSCSGNPGPGGDARLGMGIDKADNDARTRIDAIRVKLTAGVN